MIAALLALAFQCPDGSPPPCRAARAAAPATNSVAVLYFESSGGDSADTQLASGMTEEVISALGQIERLDVRSRYVSRRLVQGSGDPLAAAKAAGLAWLVTGTMQPLGDHIALRAELLQPATGRVKWSHRYDWPRRDLAGLLSQLSQVIATQIAGELLPVERSRLARGPRPVDPLVSELVLRSRFLFNQYDSQAMKTGITLLEQAVQRDSAYAPAWSLLASELVIQRDFGAPAAVLGRARNAAARALALDSADAWAWTSLSMAMVNDLEVSARAESVVRRAVALAPRDPMTVGTLGVVLVFRGKFDEGVAAARAAVALDSSSPLARSSLALRLVDARRWDEAIDAWGQWASLAPAQAGRRQSFVSYVRRQQGRCAEALALAAEDADTARMVQALPCAGRPAEARAIVDAHRAGRPLSFLAWFILQEPDSAIAALTERIDGHRPFDPESLLDTAIDPYRRDPRFVALMAKIGLP
jgi:TolB-like protein/cytochrome c-type biogenesis protein CcmH/NrfG